MNLSSSMNRTARAAVCLPAFLMVLGALPLAAQNNFNWAVLAKQGVTLTGNVEVDSFNSADPSCSTNGQYAPSLRDANGNIASASASVTAVSDTGSPKICGYLATCPAGSARLSGGASAGSLTWVNDGNTGIEPAWYSNNLAAVSIPDAVLPAVTFLPLKQVSGTVNGTNYTYVITNGCYQCPFGFSLSSHQSMCIRGDVILNCPGGCQILDQAFIYIAPHSKLTVYLGGPCLSEGCGIINGTGYATNCCFTGLSSCTNIQCSCDCDFIGTVYAPCAAFHMKCSGKQIVHFVGALCCCSADIRSCCWFHYDKCLSGCDCPPVVVSPLMNLTNCPGTPATFTVSATGNRLGYQWYKGTTLLPGQTTDKLSFASVADSDAAIYSVAVTDACGDSKTNSACLVVNQPLHIACGPASLTNAPGTVAVFSITAAGSGLSYQWFQGCVLLAGQTNSTLTLCNVTGVSAGIYTVVVTDACGDSQTNSACLTIQCTITSSAGAGGTISPSGNVMVNAGASQSFIAMPNPGYGVNQWLLDGTLAQTGGASYTLSDVQTNHTLMVTFSPSAPPIVQPLTALSAIGSVTLNWPALPDPSLQYHVYRSRNTNTFMADLWLLASVSARGTNGQYVDLSGQPGIGYYYAVSAINSNGLEGPLSLPAIGTNLIGWPQAASKDLGGELQMCVTAVSTVPLTYQWLLNGKMLSDEGLVTGSQSPCLGVGGVLTNGQFAVIVSGSMGSVTSPPVQLTVAEPAFQIAKGIYAGLFYPPDEPTAANSGAFSLILTKRGTFTGRARYPARTVMFSGKFDTNGYSVVKTTGTGQEAPLYLQLDTTPGLERITGTITNGNSVAGLYVFLTGPSAETPSKGFKYFTLAMPGASDPTTGPEGWSCFTATLGHGNKLLLSGTLADGSIVSQLLPLSTTGDYPMFAPLYQGTGLLLGWLKFTNDTAHGDWTLWTKPGWRRTVPDGISIMTNVIGSLYVPPAAGSNVLVLANGTGLLTLQNTSVGLLLTNDVWLADNKVNLSNDVNKVTMTFGAAHGRFIGGFLPPGAQAKVALHGVVLQDQGEAVGSFLEQGQGGCVSLEQSDP